MLSRVFEKLVERVDVLIEKIDELIKVLIVLKETLDNSKKK